MRQKFVIEGMHCAACVQRVMRALQGIANEVEVTLEPALAVIESPQPISVDEVQAAVAQAGSYKAFAA